MKSACCNLHPMLEAGIYHNLTVLRETPIGLYLDDGAEGILLPKRFVPANTRLGETLRVFVYHDGEERLIATTQQPFAQVGEIARLRAVSVNQQGAFLDWGLMKDLFVPKSRQLQGMRVNGEYLVMLYRDEQTGRVAATEKLEPLLSNDEITVNEMDVVDLVTYRRTDIGYVMIINNRHTGVLHFSDIFRDIRPGDRFKGYIKTIRPENKIDVMLGQPGFKRVEDETGKVLRLLEENNGYLPYNDKSSPDDIYAFFGMSKKTFKMTTGGLYKQKKIDFTQTGIKLLSD
jgi:uncharacterized protein